MANPAALPSRSKGRIFIIDDEPAMGHILVKSLTVDGFDATAYTDPREALKSVPQLQPDVVLTDIRMPIMSGKEVLERMKAEYPEVPVLVLTAFGTIEDAVEILKAGAFNYITKPFQHDTLVHQIDLALRQRRLQQEVIRLSDQGYPPAERRAIIGGSPALAKVRSMITRAAQTDSSVLITGESGVGKELVAREVHSQSARRGGRFVAVNCPAIPSTLIESEMFGYERGAFTGADHPKMGLIELSHGGTLFLDEIAELPNELQAKLLRVLQEREILRLGGLRQMQVDLRIIAATNRELEVEIEAKRFRIDLFYRLNVIPIHVPPLRERAEDIPELAEFLLKKVGRRGNRPGLEISPAAIERLKEYSWPGNIRELENTLERLAVLSDDPLIDEKDLPPHILAAPRSVQAEANENESSANLRAPWPQEYRLARDRFERSYLKQLLKECGGNVAQASRISGVSRRSLYEKFDKIGMKKENLIEDGTPETDGMPDE